MSGFMLDTSSNSVVHMKTIAYQNFIMAEHGKGQLGDRYAWSPFLTGLASMLDCDVALIELKNSARIAWNGPTRERKWYKV